MLDGSPFWFVLLPFSKVSLRNVTLSVCVQLGKKMDLLGTHEYGTDGGVTKKQNTSTRPMLNTQIIFAVKVV